MKRYLFSLAALAAFALPAMADDAPKYVLIDGKVQKVEARVSSAEARIADLEKQVADLRAALALKASAPVKLPNCACGDNCPCGGVAKTASAPTGQRVQVCDAQGCRWVTVYPNDNTAAAVYPTGNFGSVSSSCTSGNCGQAPQQRWRPGAVLFGRR